jgi:Leucine-rich repeat (LRR) protein
MNSLDGSIPDLLPYSGFTSLRFLGLTKNSLSGEIPSSLGNLTSLVYFLASQNNLTGSIPGSLARLSHIQVIDLTYNSLSGTVPDSIFNLSLLTYLGLGENGFAGKLPSTTGNNLPNIHTLILQANNLQGEIPKSIANATNLVNIYLQDNSLGGVIPSLGTLRSLQTLFLYNNKKLEAGDDWAFLTSLTNCTLLGFLVLYGNRLQGALPSSVANLSKNLEQLDLGSNLITGAIPSGIGDLAGLPLLYLDNNMLSGPIPASIGKLHNLFVLNLSKNRLSGKIPTSIGNWVKLTELYLQENSLSGAIPAELAGCRNLLALNLSSNALSGPIPEGLFSKLDQLSLFLDLSKNQLTGSIPDEFSNMINLESLNISSNNISGKIPSTLGSCVLLQALRLEVNSLGGQIPSSLATLKGINELDFSRNNLSGKIPEFFELFNGLQYLNLSFNNLDGPIPTKGVVFGNATSRLFLQGNPKLCAMTSMLGLPLCTPQNLSERNRFLVRFLAILLPCVVVVSLLFVLFLKRWSRKPRRFHEPFEESFKMVTYNDLSIATNGFSSGNLIGSGQSSSVYKGSLPAQTDDGQMMIAVKVFKLGQSSSSKSFLVECRALRNTRHRNLVKVITACSACDPFGNDFKALVLEYMPNGTLADHLHTKSPGYGYLSLGDRIGIAADVASVLEYLHIWSVPPMAHCDIKPSNILLDDDNVSHVGDFGLARLLHAPSSSGGHRNSTSFVGARGSVGYIPPGESIYMCHIYSYFLLLYST